MAFHSVICFQGTTFESVNTKYFTHTLITFFSNSLSIMGYMLEELISRFWLTYVASYSIIQFSSTDFLVFNYFVMYLDLLYRHCTVIGSPMTSQTQDF